jgi:hypothetical protein
VRLLLTVSGLFVDHFAVFLLGPAAVAAILAFRRPIAVAYFERVKKGATERPAPSNSRSSVLCCATSPTNSSVESKKPTNGAAMSPVRNALTGHFSECLTKGSDWSGFAGLLDMLEMEQITDRMIVSARHLALVRVRGYSGGSARPSQIERELIRTRERIRLPSSRSIY